MSPVANEYLGNIIQFCTTKNNLILTSKKISPQPCFDLAPHGVLRGVDQMQRSAADFHVTFYAGERIAVLASSLLSDL